MLFSAEITPLYDNSAIKDTNNPKLSPSGLLHQILLATPHKGHCSKSMSGNKNST